MSPSINWYKFGGGGGKSQLGGISGSMVQDSKRVVLERRLTEEQRNRGKGGGFGTRLRPRNNESA